MHGKTLIFFLLFSSLLGKSLTEERAYKGCTQSVWIHAFPLRFFFLCFFAPSVLCSSNQHNVIALNARLLPVHKVMTGVTRNCVTHCFLSLTHCGKNHPAIEQEECALLLLVNDIFTQMHPSVTQLPELTLYHILNTTRWVK